MNKIFTAFFAMIITVFPAYAENIMGNDIHRHCIEIHGYDGINGDTDFSSIAACVHKIRVEIRKQEEAELWEFLKANPRYRVPGQSLNKCFGRPKERALARLETKADGSTMAYYKDKVKECY